jgi:hypothetical protein
MIRPLTQARHIGGRRLKSIARLDVSGHDGLDDEVERGLRVFGVDPSKAAMEM